LKHLNHIHVEEIRGELNETSLKAREWISHARTYIYIYVYV